jgi:TonB-linked SusC/RagA family outer membrane protein
MRKAILSLLWVALSVGQLFAQTRTISGKVTDSKGAPIPNASVLEKGTNSGSVTKEDGTFTVTVSPKARTLVITSIGMASTEINIGSKTSIDVTLQPADNNLAEVVVVGYQTLKRAEVTSAIVTVGGKELAQKPIGAFTQLLQGKAAGVQVTGQSGRPGQNGYIRVRGTGSINASSEPLIVLDGIYITGAAYNMLNPNDIDDVTVLKDAAAQAIYGSRGANGVLIITTKKGKGKPELRYSFQYGRSKAQELKNINLMSGMQKLQYEFEDKYTNPILDSMISNRIGSGAFPGGSTLASITDAQRQDLWSTALGRGAGNWRDYLLNDAVMTTHELSLQGASDKFKYYFSMNKSNNEGVLYGSYWNRTGGRLNIEYNALDWFKLGVNSAVTYTTENQVREAFNSQNAYASVFLFNPYEPVYLADGKTYNPTLQGFNPMEGADNNPQIFDRISAYNTIFGEAKFLKHLTLKSQLALNYNTFKEEYYLKPGSNLANILGYNQKRDGGNNEFVYVFTNTAIWQQTVAERHSVSVLGGTEFSKDKFYSYSLTGRNFPTASVNTLDNSAQPTAATTSRQDWSLLSYFANATYDFDKKYYITLSGRRDGSSRFGRNKQYANFWGVSAAWDIAKEDFMKTTSFISGLKLRASIGTAGTVPGGLYDNLGVYSLANKYNDLPAAVPARIENPDLTWETNQNYDIGVDFAVLNNRISGTVDYYRRKTNDLIYPKNISLTTGFGSYTSNIGNLENKGIEVSLSGDVVKTKDLTVTVFANYTHNDNKVLKLYSDNVPQTLSRLKVGEPLFTYFLVKWAGVDPADGKNQFYKADGTITKTYSSGDAVLLSGKSPNVKYYGSFGVSASYKGLDLSAQFYYSGGNYIFNYVYQTGANEGEDPSIPQFTDAFDYWKKPGDKTSFANLLDPTQKITYNTDRYLDKGDYVSLRDLTLGYTLNGDLARKIKMKGIRLYVQGTNLWIGTKFRGLPEVGQSSSENATPTPGLSTLYGYPQLRAVTFGVDVRF